MLTAATITDEEIRALRDRVAGLAVEPHVSALCDLALACSDEARIVVALKSHRQRQARARCAEILNTRASEAK